MRSRASACWSRLYARAWRHGVSDTVAGSATQTSRKKRFDSNERSAQTTVLTVVALFALYWLAVDFSMETLGHEANLGLGQSKTEAVVIHSSTGNRPSDLANTAGGTSVGNHSVHESATGAPTSQSYIPPEGQVVMRVNTTYQALVVELLTQPFSSTPLPTPTR